MKKIFLIIAALLCINSPIKPAYIRNAKKASQNTPPTNPVSKTNHDLYTLKAIQDTNTKKYQNPLIASLNFGNEKIPKTRKKYLQPIEEENHEKTDKQILNEVISTLQKNPVMADQMLDEIQKEFKKNPEKFTNDLRKQVSYLNDPKCTYESVMNSLGLKNYTLPSSSDITINGDGLSTTFDAFKGNFTIPINKNSCHPIIKYFPYGTNIIPKSTPLYKSIY